MEYPYLTKSWLILNCTEPPGSSASFTVWGVPTDSMGVLSHLAVDAVGKD